MNNPVASGIGATSFPRLARRNLPFWTNLLLLLLIAGFLLTYFEPRLLLLDTTPTGGDTPSHFTAAVHFRQLVLDYFEITGWEYGNLAGYPLMHYYFPFPFLLCTLLSLLLPLAISFKIVSVLGVFLLPFCAFYFLERLDFPFPTPILGAAVTLPFLLVESQSMWGGNVPSTLAGEFTYSLGMALALVYLGRFRQGAAGDKHAWSNAALLALTGFSHGCALLVCGAMTFFCVFEGDDAWRRLRYFVRVNVLGFLLLAFWLVPWLSYQQFMSAFNFLWVFHSWRELFPTVLLPIYACAALAGLFELVGLVRRRQGDGRAGYLWFGVLACAVFFHIGYQLNVVDVRFIPFLQLFLALIAAAFFGTLLARLQIRWPFAIAGVLLALVWADQHSSTVRQWIRWNYEGFEQKASWPLLREVSAALRGTLSDPRVVYEHSADHDRFGSIRTFESLPLLAGRATLEGAYLQSSINSPFIFYLQSEVSEVTSCPLPDYYCSALDLKRALPHLELFNVSQLLLRSPAAQKQARGLAGLVLEKSAPPLEIYRVTANTGRYVVALPQKPVLYTGPTWKRESFDWYRRYVPGTPAVVIDDHPAREDLQGFSRSTSVFPAPEAGPVEAHQCRVEEKLEQDRIQIQTSCIGHPLLIKMSFHPRWRVRGASKIYLATPGFMLVFPRQHSVELRFGWATANYVGAALTLMGLLSVVFFRIAGLIPDWISRSTGFSVRFPGAWSLKPGAWLETPAAGRRLRLALAGAAILFPLAVFLAVSRNDSNILFEEGVRRFAREDFESAIPYFRAAEEAAPESSFGINGRFYWGLSLYRQKKYNEAADVLQVLAEKFPESMHAPEALFHVGLSRQATGGDPTSFFQKTIDRYPDSRWADFSRERFKSSLFDLGIREFDRQNYAAAQDYFRRAAGDLSNTAAYRAQAEYFAAICDFKRSDWQGTLDGFRRLIARYPTSEWVAEALYHCGLSEANLNRKAAARQNLLEVIRRFPNSRWATYSRNRLDASDLR